MKLKLDHQDTGVVLTVTESIELSHLPILKAGLGKLLKQSKLPWLLDLCGVPDERLKGGTLVDELQALRTWASSLDRVLLIASPVAGLGDASDRATALALLERTCELQLQSLESRKRELTARLQAKDEYFKHLTRLRRENTELRKRIALAEALLSLGEKRPAPLFAENAARLRTAKQVLQAALASQGVSV